MVADLAAVWRNLSIKAKDVGSVTISKGVLDILWDSPQSRHSDAGKQAYLEAMRAENASLTDRCERLAAAYLEVETDAVQWGAIEHCINHGIQHDYDRVAESFRESYRNDLHPGDLPGDALGKDGK